MTHLTKLNVISWLYCGAVRFEDVVKSRKEQENPEQYCRLVTPLPTEFFFSKKNSRSKLKILALMPVVIHTQASLPTRARGNCQRKISEGNTSSSLFPQEVGYIHRDTILIA